MTDLYLSSSKPNNSKKNTLKIKKLLRSLNLSFVIDDLEAREIDWVQEPVPCSSKRRDEIL